MNDTVRTIEQKRPGHTWDELRTRGKTAYFQCRPAEAEWLLTQALHMAEAFGEKDARLVMSLSDLAGLYVMHKRFEPADSLLARAVSLGRTLLPRHDFHSLKRKFESNRAVLVAQRNGKQPGRLPFRIKWI